MNKNHYFFNLFQKKVKFLASSILLLLPAVTWAGVKLPDTLLAIEKKYKKAGTLEADFSQVNENSNLSQRKKLSSGKLQLRFPSQVRWDTQKPDRNLLVSDGQTFWYYTKREPLKYSLNWLRIFFLLHSQQSKVQNFPRNPQHDFSSLLTPDVVETLKRQFLRLTLKVL